MDIKTIVPLSCFKDVQIIYSNSEYLNIIIKLNKEDPNNEDTENLQDINDINNTQEINDYFYENTDSNSQELESEDDKENFVKIFNDKYPEVSKKLFNPLCGSRTQEESLKKFKEQGEIIDLISKYMPTKENLVRMLANSNPTQLANNLKDFNNLTLQDYFMPPMLLSFMFLDPSLQSDQVKEEIYEILPKNQYVTTKLVQEKHEILSDQIKEDNRHKTIFGGINEKMKK